MKKRSGSTNPLVIARFVVILYFVLTFDVCNTFCYNAITQRQLANEYVF